MGTRVARCRGESLGTGGLRGLREGLAEGQDTAWEDSFWGETRRTQEKQEAGSGRALLYSRSCPTPR